MRFLRTISRVASNGLKGRADPEVMRVIRLLNLYMIVIGGISATMIVVDFIQDKYGFFNILGANAGLMVLSAFFLGITGRHSIVANFLLMGMTALGLYLVATGGSSGDGPLWALVFPPLALFVFGPKKGSIAVAFFFLSVLLMFFGPAFPILKVSYTFDFRFRFGVAFVTIFLFAWLAEYSRMKSHLHMLEILAREQEEAQKRLELEEKLQQSQKMEAVGRLAGGIAHDFNNLLTGILSYSSFVKAELPKDSQTSRDMEAVIDATLRAGALTTQLLAFGRKQTIRVKTTDLNRVIEKIARRLDVLGIDKIDLKISLGPSIGKIKADAQQLEQLLSNLITNAKEAMPNGGTLLITTSNVAADDDFRPSHTEALQLEYVKLSVTDDGIGMEDSIKAKIFEPFFTTKKLGHGAGLGLSTVYGIVRQNGYSINVKSSPNKGTTMSVYFPRAYEDGTLSSFPTYAVPLVGSKTILVAEDEDIVRKSTVRMLKHENYNVLEAPNGEAALEIATAFGGKIDLLLTDVIMPGISGKTLADELSKTRPETKVLFMSGYTEDAIAINGVLEEKTAFLPKPFSVADLTDKIKRTLGLI